MDTLELFAWLIGVCLVSEAFILIIGKDLHIEFPGVLFLLSGPLAVVLVEGNPVVVNLLVDLDIADLER